MKRKSIRKTNAKQKSDSLFGKIRLISIQFSSFIYGIADLMKKPLSLYREKNKEKDTGIVDLIPPDTFSERASKKAEEISMSVRSAIKQLLVSAEDNIQQALNQEKSKRAFNKAAKKAGKKRRAGAKSAAGKIKERQLVQSNSDTKKTSAVKTNKKDNKTSAVKKDKKNNSTAKKKKKLPLYRRVLSLVIKIMIFSLGLIVVFGYIFGLSRNQSLNMQPSFQDGDLVLYLRTYNSYKANDTIVISYEDKTMLERVIAVAGDTVDITESGLEVNGGLVQESYAWGETTQFENGVTFPLTVPEGKIFVLGDNREHATDSRILGCIDEKDVSGSVIGTFRRRNF